MKASPKGRSSSSSSRPSAKPAEAPASRARGGPRHPSSRSSERPPGPRRLRGLSSRAFEHPADTAALAALRKLPGFETFLRRLFAVVGDRSLRLAFLGSAVRVGPHQFPVVFDGYRRVGEILDVDPLPELYVAQTPFVNAGALGLGQPFIVLNSGSLELFDEHELQFLLGHELGHVLSGHGLYKTVIRLLARLSLPALSIPAGSAALLALSAALLEWDRKSELSADRAGLLAVQDLEVSVRALMKMAGGGRTDEMSVREFEEQAREYEEAGSVLDSVLKLLQLTGQTHPFPVLRVAALRGWADSGAYEGVLLGEYARRSDAKDASILDDLKRSAEGYKEAFETSRDPLVRGLRDLLEELKRGRPK